MDGATITAASAVAIALVTSAFNVVTAIKGKKTPDVTALEIRHIDDRSALTDDQRQLITDLRTECSLLRVEIDKINNKWLASQQTILQLTSEVGHNKMDIDKLNVERDTHKQKCDETIERLTADNETLRSQVSNLQLENGKLIAGVKAFGGDVEKILKDQGRRLTDKDEL